MKGRGTAGGAKKMVIKPFKVAPKVSGSLAEDLWKQKLEVAVDAVYSKKETQSHLSKEELYRAVEDICIQKLGPKVYTLLCSKCEERITEKVDSLQQHTLGSDQSMFLAVVDGIWKDYCEQINTIRNIFLYLDRSYALQNQGIKLIWDMGNEIFRRRLDYQLAVQNKIISGLLASIEQQRNRQTCDSDTVARLCSMLNTLDLYNSTFERLFLQDSERFFCSEGQQYSRLIAIGDCDVAQFLLHVDSRLVEAVELTHRALHTSTKRPLLQTVENQLLKPHVTQLVERGFKQLLDENRIDDLKRMYKLLHRVSSLEILKQGWVLYIRTEGETLTHGNDAPSSSSSSSNAPKQGTPSKAAAVDGSSGNAFVEEVLRLQDKLQVVMQTCFHGDEAFKTGLKSGFEYFINIKRKSNNAAEMMAKYVDRKMRGEKGVSEAMVESLLDRVMVLFRHLHEKDVFEAHYKKHLSKRLLLSKSQSYELERSMLAKLKTECGASFTAKLEGMFQDIELSTQCMTEFKQHMQEESEGSGDRSAMQVDPIDPLPSSSLSSSSSSPEAIIKVLTTGYWPATPSTDGLILPRGLKAIMTKFSNFYTQRYQGRRLAWSHSLERCLISAHFNKGRKDLEVSLFQAMVLHQFNSGGDQRTVAFAEMKTMTGIEDGELRRTLQSLACGPLGTRVLTKVPKGREVDDTDTFLVNLDFSNKLFRIKINSIQLKETVAEAEKTNEEVFRDREYQVDASIVRTMKSRKRLSHTILIGELMAQLKFPASTADLKRRIESLIERDYLERDPDDTAFYNYLA